MIRSRHILVGAALALALVTGSAGARQYKNAGAPTESIGVVPEVNDQAVSTANPLPVSVVGGGGSGGASGSVTAPGTNGTQAQAVQGINGGVPVAIQGGNATAVKTDGSATTQPVSASALPLPAGAATAANQVMEIGSLATIAQRAVTFTDVTGLAVTANGTYTGTVRDLGAAPAYTRMNVAIYSAQNGTVTIQACQDAGCGAAFTVALQQVVVNTSVWATVSAPVYTRYMRLIFQNGSTASNITVSSSFTAS